MSTDEPSPDDVPPSAQRGGDAPTDDEAKAKGHWAATAQEGVVPADDGGSDPPSELQGEDPQLASSVLGATTGSDEPATRDGVDRSGGDRADATTHGGAKRPADAEPDLRDAAAGPRQVDLDSEA